MAVKNYGIHDQWTNLEILNNVDIKSVDGVIESVKINGEEAGGGGGSSDFSTAEVTVNSRGNDYEVAVPWCDDPSGLGLSVRVDALGDPFTLQIPIYKNDATLLISLAPLTVSGDIEAGGNISLFGLTFKAYYITGDCTIS